MSEVLPTSAEGAGAAPVDEGHGEIVRTLDALATRGTEHLYDVRSAADLGQGLRFAPWLLLVFPGLVFFIQIVQTVHGAARWSPGVILGGVGTLLIPGLYLLARRWLEPVPAAPRVEGLGLFDKALDLEDRLTTADEFLALEEQSDFTLAAIEDSRDALSRAQGHAFEPAVVETPAPPWLAKVGGGALALLVLTLLIGQAEPAAPIRTRAPEVAQVPTTPGDTTTPRTPPIRDVRQPRPANPEPKTKQPAAAPGEEARRAATDLEMEAKRTEGRTKGGQSSASESASGSNDAKGSPSNQGPSSKKDKKPGKTKPTRTPKKKKDDKPPQEQPKKEELQESGATAGRGAARGSNKNPVATSWKSKDQVEPDEEDDIEDDEDVSDDESKSEARGGMQPNLRDRRPPVSRDLTIGFGNQSSQDANGRGGPSEGKKSRGTASLVLGVPIPDRVKGQPNPGRTKVTQERVEPRAEPVETISAEGRAPRAAPVGHIQTPRLDAWWRAYLRDYFLSLRAKKTQGSS